MITTTMPHWLQQCMPSTEGDRWLAAYRQQHWNDFLTSGLPTRNHERWKYADLSFVSTLDAACADDASQRNIADIIHAHAFTSEDSLLLVMVNGVFVPALSQMQHLPREVVLCRLKEAFVTHQAIVAAHWKRFANDDTCAVSKWNAALFHDGLFMHVPDDCHITQPIQVLNIVNVSAGKVIYPRHLMVLGKRSKLTILEECVVDTANSILTNSATAIEVGEEAQLDYCKLQASASQAMVLANTCIHQQQNSRVALTHFNISGQFIREEVCVKLNGAGAECMTSGLSDLKETKQFSDFHIDVEHMAPHSRSDMLFKGVIDQHSRAVFNGRLHVLPNVQKISAYQANHNLLLSKQAEAYSKPELEIYSDDVKCKHGATTGQLDDDALFYLRARGIDRAEAVKMLLVGFTDDIVERVPSSIKSHVRHQLNQQGSAK